MGAIAQVLLVAVEMLHRLGRTLAISLLASLSACGTPPNAMTDKPDDAYRAVWLWGGVRPQPILNHARTLYLLQGEVTATTGQLAQWTPQGYGVRQLPTQRVWLVVRATTLNWNSSVWWAIRQRILQWEKAGTPIYGLQIDFDSGTHGLVRYVDFLKQIRQTLPPPYRLGVTGLLDWANVPRVSDLRDLTQTVDELILQTYQHKQTVPRAERYVRRLMQLQIPFKLGLVQGGQWTAPQGLEQDPLFQGYVLFLVNQAHGPPSHFGP